MDKWRCFLCGGQVYWNADFDFDDFGYDGQGIVSNYTCSECGAEYEVTFRLDDDDEEPPSNSDATYRQLTWEDQ